MKHTLKRCNCLSWPYRLFTVKVTSNLSQKLASKPFRSYRWVLAESAAQLQNEVPTFAFLVMPGADPLWKSENRTLILDKIKVIKFLLSSHNKTNPTNQHIFLEKRERRCMSLAVPNKSQFLQTQAFESKGAGFESPTKKAWPTYLISLSSVSLSQIMCGNIYLIERLQD